MPISSHQLNIMKEHHLSSYQQNIDCPYLHSVHATDDVYSFALCFQSGASPSLSVRRLFGSLPPQKCPHEMHGPFPD